MAATKTLVNLVEIKELVLNFLESINFLSEIISKCDHYKQNITSESTSLPLFFALSVDFEEIEKRNLAELVTSQTERFLDIFNEAIQSLANSYLRDSNLNICVQQIHSNFLIYNLPQTEYNFSLCSAHINVSLSTFSCIVSSIQGVEKYIRQSTWKCSHCFNSPLIIIRDRKISHKAPKCNRCLKDCTEQIENRVTSNFCSVRVFEANLLKNRKNYSSTSTIEIRLFDDLCQELKIGQEYIVVGIYEVFNKFYNVFSILLV